MERWIWWKNAGENGEKWHGKGIYHGIYGMCAMIYQIDVGMVLVETWRFLQNIAKISKDW